MKRFKGIRGMVVFLVLLCMLAGYYFYLSNKSESGEEETETTKVQEVLLRDLSRNYPASPKEVLRYYSEILQCMYNEDCSDEELEQLANRAMEICDTELSSYQSGEFIDRLREDVQVYKDQNVQISSYKTSNSTDVDYFTKDGRECASLYCTYTLRMGTSLQALDEIFIMRKDEAGHWKILGWDEADPENKQAAGE